MPLRQTATDSGATHQASFFGFTITAGPGGSYNLQHSLSHGTVTLNTSDPTAEPIVDYRALSNPTDVAILVAGMRFVRSFMTTNLPEDFAAAKPYELSPGANVTTDEEIEAWLRRTGYIPTLYHPIGTAAKMPRELGGVVDETLLVHGVQKLSVVDASIMPTMPGAPTSQTVYMIAEKAAELIKARA